MGRPRKKRRQSHGSAWHWKQTDCWYYTLPGTKRRVPLFDDHGQRIRGAGNQQAAERAFAQVRVAGAADENGAPLAQEWLVARVCSEYLQYCERGVAAGTISKGHQTSSVAWLNDLCSYCGGLPVAKLKKGHIQEWIGKHSGWRSQATHRSVIAVVLAAFNLAEEMFDVPSPLKGLKKPAATPRLHSLSAEDEKELCEATEECFRTFLFAAIHTGLRPVLRIGQDHRRPR